jgi:class 3 adenylate cyclase
MHRQHDEISHSQHGNDPSSSSCHHRSSSSSSFEGRVVDEDGPRKPLHESESEEIESLNHKQTVKETAANRTKRLVNNFLDSNATITFMSLITVYALYGDDVRIIAFQPNVDIVFLTLSAVASAFFLIEISLLCWCKDGYLRRPDLTAIGDICSMYAWNKRKSTFEWLSQLWNVLQPGSFYFWLDLISTFSMVIEMPWFIQSFGVGDEGGGEGGGIDSTVDAGTQAANNLKVLRILRMVRLVRLAKLYKYISQSSTPYNSSSSMKASNDSLDIFPPGSHVGAEMSDRTTKKVIVGILIMLIGIPLLQADEVAYRNKFAMTTVFESRMLLLDGIDNGEVENWEFAESLFVESTDCIDITYSGFNDGLVKETVMPEGRSRMQDLRIDAMEVITVSDASLLYSMTSVFDITGRVREEAILGILLTSFVIILLGLGMVSFTKDVHNLVIVPIEHMIQLVREISENPLGKDLSIRAGDNSKQKDDGMETTLLIRTISKIAGLMRVGFGEAGADIIGKNLNITQGTDAINLLGTGRKIHSIFGFCDVRQFTDTTECLQEEVMLFVNRIAHILHSIVVQCDGAANKNIGDAFLLTWKVNTTGADPQQITSCADHNYAADKALYSFVKTMIEMSRHEDFLCNFSPRSLAELYERIPGYKCRIGCGLHFGWAIEGAIGSSKKIDASYISPHVNMSESLEGATKDYGTPILMSEPFYNLLSPEAAAGCRKVDATKSLYTFDIDLSIDFAHEEGKQKKATNKKKNDRARKKNRPIATRKTQFSLIADDHGADLHGALSEGLGRLPRIKIRNDFPNVWKTDQDVLRVSLNLSK